MSDDVIRLELVVEIPRADLAAAAYSGASEWFRPGGRSRSPAAEQLAAMGRDAMVEAIMSGALTAEIKWLVLERASRIAIEEIEHELRKRVRKAARMATSEALQATIDGLTPVLSETETTERSDK